LKYQQVEVGLMRGPSFLSQPVVQRLAVLLKEVQSGEIRIPRFQRPFVWKSEQRILLMESIYEGMPIGSILVWRTREHDLKSYERLGPLPLRSRKGVELKQYLLDGHQRLTTLYAALGEGLSGDEIGDENGAVETAQPSRLTEDDENWPIYFDLVAREFTLAPRRGDVSSTWLPLSILLDPFEMSEFRDSLKESGADRALLNRAEALSSTFKDYSIPVVPIVTEDLELVTESFQRINSAGTKMDEVHMINALTWTPDFDLNEKMEEILSGLGSVGWEKLEEKIVLNTSKAALGLDIYKADAKATQLALQKRPEVLEEAADYLDAAARFLREKCDVYGPSTLPYSFQIVLLADALRLASESDPEASSDEVARSLHLWFWLTTYTEYFASINSTRLRKALEHLQAVVTEGADPRPADLPAKVTYPQRFDFRAARSRAIALRMAKLNPRNAAGEPQEPFQLLADHGRDAAPMLIPSREVGDRKAAEGPENRLIVHPRDANTLRRLLLESPGDCSEQILRSHAISPEAANALAERDYGRFLSLRKERLAELERVFVGTLGLEYATD
jgi:hypothetical protein